MKEKEKQQVINTPANYSKRIISGSIILVLIVGFLALRLVSNYIFDVLVAGIMVISALEVENLLHKMDRPTNTVAVCLFPMMLFASIVICANSGLNYLHFILINFAILFAMAFIIFAYPLVLQKIGMRAKNNDGYNGGLLQYSFSRMINTVFVCVWPTIFLSFMFIINHIEILSISGVANYYVGLGANIGLLGLVLLFATTIIADVCAMLSGRFIGGPKISLEKLGPGKSWAGLIGGILGGAIASILVFTIFNLFAGYNYLFASLNISVWAFLLGGIFCGLFNMMGDIMSSFFKRRAVVKDFSALIPGHGGVMDRCNGLLANALVVFLFLIILFG